MLGSDFYVCTFFSNRLYLPWDSMFSSLFLVPLAFHYQGAFQARSDKPSPSKGWPRLQGMAPPPRDGPTSKGTAPPSKGRPASKGRPHWGSKNVSLDHMMWMLELTASDSFNWLLYPETWTLDQIRATDTTVGRSMPHLLDWHNWKKLQQICYQFDINRTPHQMDECGTRPF